MGQEPQYNNLVLSRHDFKLTYHLQINVAAPSIPIIELNTGPGNPKWLIGSFLGSDTYDIQTEIEVLTKELPNEADVTLMGDFRRKVPTEKMPEFTSINPNGSQYLLHRSRNPFYHVEGYECKGLLTAACTT